MKLFLFFSGETIPLIIKHKQTQIEKETIRNHNSNNYENKKEPNKLSMSPKACKISMIKSSKNVSFHL